ncbi:kell blood group glycoprotein-like isoform X3 [Pleurodeles waltl]|uniref:kell blood group glycoprotein-like isoform X3 n=1 Tax=Pleurodeles waltl TaxID=8319 RepID=UPI0037097976
MGRKGTSEAFFEEHERSDMASKRKKWMTRGLPLGLLLVVSVITLLLVLNFTILSCSRGFRPCETTECKILTEKFLSSRDLSIDPCQDFFGHICGMWDTSDTLGLGTGSVNTFDVLWEENQLLLKALLERKEHVTRSSAEEKALTFYKSCMNTEKIESLGAQPMVDLINKVGGWSVAGAWNRTDFDQTLRLLIGEYNVFPFFRAYLHSSPLNPTLHVIQIDHPEFDMPSKNQFEKESEYTKALRVYLSYLQNLTAFLGGEINTVVIPSVFAFTSKLLNVVTPLPERQERQMLFTPTSIAVLQGLAPAIDWLSCLQAAFYPRELNSSEIIFVHDMDYMVEMSQLVDLWRKSYLQAYMVLCLVHSLYPALDKRFQDARRELTAGIQKSEADSMEVVPRWKKCISDTSRFFEPVLGAMFIKETFSPETKKVAEAMFAEVKDALDKRLDQLKWMDEESHRNAKQKLQSIVVKIGYPLWIMDDELLEREYRQLHLGEDSFFQNVVQLKAPRESALFGTLDPHGHDNWEVDPSSVHSYYSISQNAVVFPAGMFRSPFFQVDFPSAVNFGAIGVFMAHELLHAFNEYVPHPIMSGDENGLEERLLCMEKQYNSYTLQNLTVNGTVTLLENMADCGGLAIAQQAYENWLKRRKQETVLPQIGFTHSQLFFASFAQSMCGKQTLEKLRSFLSRDRHSPNPLRVRGAISNSDNFHIYFQCPQGSPMNPEQKCHMW